MAHFWSSWERTFWSSWEIAAVRYPWHGWSAVEDWPRPEAGSAPNVRQYNSGTCICWSQICMKRAKIQCMSKAPFLWATINSPSEVDLWRRRERCMLCRCFTLELNRIPFAGFNHVQNVQICIVYRDHPSLKQSIICLWTALTDYKGRDTGNNKMEQRSQELDWDMHMSCMYFHSLPSARLVSVCPWRWCQTV